MENDRRDFLKKGAMLAIAGLGTQLFSGNLTSALGATPLEDSKEFTLPPLPYAYDALEPVIDKMTMEIHHTKHHQAYVNNLNKALKEAKASYTTLEMLIAHAGTYIPAVRNNAGGHWNHSFFWKIMKPGGGGAPQGKLADAIIASFNTMDEFKTKFNEAGTKRFGSGWAWLYLDSNKKLAIGSTPNQDNPMMDISDIKGVPIMGVDVWEHAYYLKYQNRRPEYLAAWWNVLNWDEIAHNFDLATK